MPVRPASRSQKLDHGPTVICVGDTPTGSAIVATIWQAPGGSVVRTAERDAASRPAVADPPLSEVPARVEPDEQTLRRRDRKLALALMASSAMLVMLILAGAWLLTRPD
jgi:hypothetical protein